MAGADGSESRASIPTRLLVVRGGLGGVMMGLANLVPGISGGTMLLAVGIYPQFVAAIADVSTLKFRRQSLLVLAVVVLAALLAIVGFAGPVRDFVVGYRFIAYSLFIGLTLGGLPVVWRLVKGLTRPVMVGALLGFAGMAALAWAQVQGADGSQASSDGFGMMFLAGVLGASAMILPGVSGGYLLLVLGVYVTILSAIKELKDALMAAELAALVDPIMGVVLPVGLGVVVGVITVSNVLKWLLVRYEQLTLGLLLGLLVGAVVGLWPFQDGVRPEPGDTYKGEVLTRARIDELGPEDYPTRFFTPSPAQVGIALGFIVLGGAVTVGVSRLGRDHH